MSIAMRNKRLIYSTKWITYTAILTALVVATSIIPPLPLGPYNIYWCDGMIMTGAYLMDPISSFIIGGLGSALYDFGLGKVQTALPSLIIHGLQGAAVSVFLHIVFGKFKTETLWATLSGIIGGLIVICGYLLYYWAIAPLVTGNAKFGWSYAAVRVPRNIIQEIIGIILSVLLCYATTFKKQLCKNRLLPDFYREFLHKSNDEEIIDEN